MNAISRIVLAIVTGVAIGVSSAAIVYGNAPAGPAACAFSSGVIASGDAAMTSDGREWVCTDGELVPVKDYGVAR